MATAATPSASPEPARRGPAFLISAALLCAVVIVDPLREFISQDDGWAYARSVEHLLRTGEYPFTFMSDIQFMGSLLVALWLYSRGFASRSDRELLLGSVATAFAIGTRQFGMALIAGVIVAWVLSRPASRPPLRSLLWAPPQSAEAEPCPAPAVSP